MENLLNLYPLVSSDRFLFLWKFRLWNNKFRVCLSVCVWDICTLMHNWRAAIFNWPFSSSLSSFLYRSRRGDGELCRMRPAAWTLFWTGGSCYSLTPVDCLWLACLLESWPFAESTRSMHRRLFVSSVDELGRLLLLFYYILPRWIM